MNVTITDAEKYKVVSLEKDETRTLTVKDGNYADADTSSVDTAVAGVTVTGKDVQDNMKRRWHRLPQRWQRLMVQL